MKIYFLSLASGSSGNCYYLGTKKYGILIDAGIGIRSIKKILKEHGIAMETIYGVFVTHDHADHTKAVGYLGEKLHIPVYATEDVIKGINKSYATQIKIESSARYIRKNEPTTIGDMTVTPIAVPHDGTDNVGFFIDIKGTTFSFFTDLGHITDEVKECISRTNHLVIEANYDDIMLETGPYPPLLKRRIKSDTGHMNNKDTAECLAELYTEKLKNIWLCHLSRENNHPELAYKTVELALKNKGISLGSNLSLTSLRRNSPTEMAEIEII